MKYLFSLLVLALGFSTATTAQTTASKNAVATTGIQFSQNSFDELLAEAKKEGKIIFIDAYTTWCGPCKVMSAKVFPDARVGAVYNAKFINAKIDMEKGEGPDLANRYGVAAYPTYLFVDGSGQLVHKGIGQIPKDDFIELALTASGPNSLAQLAKRYDGGDRDPEFVVSYAETLTELMEGERADEVIGNYLDNQEDWGTPANVEMIVNSPGSLGDKRMVYLIEHSAEVEKVVGSDRLMNTLQQVIVRDYMSNKRMREMPAPEMMMEHYTTFAAPMKDRLRDHYSLMYFQRTGKPELYVPAALAYYQAYPSDDMAELNSAAWTVYEISEDRAALETALGWAKKSVEIEATYPNLDTLAWLHHKLGNDTEAAEAAARGIELAEATDQDPGELRTLIK